MSTDEDDRDAAGQGRGAPGSDRADADPVRDLLLVLAAQIDHVASWFATTSPTAGSARGPAADAAAMGAAAGALLTDGGGAHLVGEVAALLRELGDLLAKLITALIAVLEAVAAALRTVPAGAAAPPRQYQPIAVRFDAGPLHPDPRVRDRPSHPGSET